MLEAEGRKTFSPLVFFHVPFFHSLLEASCLFGILLDFHLRTRNLPCFSERMPNRAKSCKNERTIITFFFAKKTFRSQRFLFFSISEREGRRAPCRRPRTRSRSEVTPRANLRPRNLRLRPQIRGRDLQGQTGRDEPPAGLRAERQARAGGEDRVFI